VITLVDALAHEYGQNPITIMCTWPLVQCFVWLEAANCRRGKQGPSYADLDVFDAIAR